MVAPFLFGAGTRSMIQWVVLIAIFMFVVPKLYFYQMFAKVEASARKLESISKKGQRTLIKATNKFGKSKKGLRQRLSHFIDFFMIPPVSLDPFGIMKKLEHLIDHTEDRFKQEAVDMAPKAGTEQSMDIFMGLQAAVMIHTIAKIVRHYVELIKKFKNLQFAMLLQMQLPMIEKLVESEYKGLKAFLNGHAIGDGAGPLVIASLLSKEGKEITPDAIALTENRWDRKITFIKAKGPGGRLGKVGEAVRVMCKKNKIAKIITIDAAQKLEGEKTGTVSEGIGAAIGGAGVQKAKIEGIAVEHDIPMEALAIKMSPFEAISPMPEEVVEAMDDAKKYLKERVDDTKKGSHILVVGVGNTCGVPNTDKNLKRIIEGIKKRAKELKKEEAKKKKGFKRRREKYNNSGAEFLSFMFGLNGYQ